MRHRTILTAGALTAVLAATALSGCSSDKKSDDAASSPPASTATGGTSTAADGGGSAPASSSAAPSKPAGKVEGHLDFTGDDTGGADFTGGVKCEIKGGKLIGVTTPDVLAKTQIFPSFIATTADSPTQVALFAAPDKKTYSGRVSKSEGVTAQKDGGTWTVKVQNLKIAKDYGGSGGVVTLNGSLTCTNTNG
ncbi:hypothetical protein NMG29_21990 [Streptomyces cocklensis]|jgi:hypothetical protein|uniref:Lipoprotein n=1 Tax=Actinacidiphila cocklensis TaxID=887465 RepID=A0A9W4DX20_9ACTN|nr:hypothetical protein [Actinacidiphila cocklensis]MDD1060851.1 hypothetical protein [Actinacidiphila cocklensis]WSX73634.1 hypothetical protein OH826_07075 [Streptomyces sp. NBC_00899]WSX80303.1 hypothetical protein OH826_44435 [Streptomyces sp. NBC_00899]CAG6397478.1 conserved exported hypothetical protein [Actinacidiphila cocklensis]